MSTPEQAQEIVRDQAICGALSPDRTRICILPPDHKEAHPWGDLVAVGMHACVTCTRCSTTFAAVHPACPRCSARSRRPGAGRFTLVAGDDAYVTSWDTWEEAAIAWPEEGRLRYPYQLIDNETGRVWLPGARHVWEDART